MNRIEDGGPAFPTRGEDFIEGPQGRMPQSAWGMEPKEGMTLRDYFAAAALTGELASFSTEGSCKATAVAAIESGREVEDQIAWNCYCMADAMLIARKGGA